MMNMKKEFYTAEFNIESILSNRITYLENILSNIQAEYYKMPEGSLLVAPCKKDTNFRYYLREKSSDKMGIYLKANQENIKREYATKKYYKELIKEIENELKQLKKLRTNYTGDSIISTYKGIGLGIKMLISPLNIDNDTFEILWKSEPFEGLGFDEKDTSSLYSNCGERMRSKSELLIANTLNRRNIPYKYECPITLCNGQKVYPDFTILDVKNRKVKYWEHLGKMGDLSYVSKNMWKLEEYKRMGIRLGINLFVTYENGVNSIGTDDINSTIDALLK